MPWKIEKDEDHKIHIWYDDFGNFKTQKDAVDIATQMARNIKTTVIIHSSKKDVDNEVLITNEDNVLDYTSFLTVEEVLDKTESDLKLARAEMTVALVESKRIAAQLKGADPVESRILKQRKKISSQRVKKAKINLKDCIRKNTIAKKQKKITDKY